MAESERQDLYPSKDAWLWWTPKAPSSKTSTVDIYLESKPVSSIQPHHIISYLNTDQLNEKYVHDKNPLLVTKIRDWRHPFSRCGIFTRSVEGWSKKAPWVQRDLSSHLSCPLPRSVPGQGTKFIYHSELLLRNNSESCHEDKSGNIYPGTQFGA